MEIKKNEKLQKAKTLGILNRLEEDEDISKINTMINIDLIDYNPKNFYSKNDTEEDIVELAESIEETGLLHNIVVKKSENGRYLLVSGEKRTKAYKYLYEKTKDTKWKLIPGKIKEDVQNEIDEEIALIRANRDVRERGDSIKALEVARLEALYKAKRDSGEKISAIRKKIATDLGISETQVQRLKQVNLLIPEFKNMLDSGEINITTVEYFTGFTPEIQKEIYYALITKGQKISREEAKELRDGVKEIIESVEQKTAAEDIKEKDEIEKDEIVDPKTEQKGERDDSTNNSEKVGTVEQNQNESSNNKKTVVDKVKKEVEIAQYFKKAVNTIKTLAEKIKEEPNQKDKLIEQYKSSIQQIKELIEEIISVD